MTTKQNILTGIKNRAGSSLWIKLFEINGVKFCYDVSTNNLMKIKDSMYETLFYYNHTNREETIKKLSSRYTENDIAEAIREIDEFNKTENAFILEKQIRLKFPFDRKEYRFVLENFLSHLILNITEDCNMRCEYCAYGECYKYHRNHRHVSMSWPIIKKAIDFFIPKSILRRTYLNKRITIGFYGGEPLLERDKIFKTIEYIKRQYPDVFTAFDFFMTTNGTLLTEEVIRQLIKYDFHIMISLDGPEDIHDRYRKTSNGKSTFKTIMKNIETLKSIDNDYLVKRVSFSIVLSPRYYIHEVLNFFNEKFPGNETTNTYNLIDIADTTFFDRFDMIEENKRYTEQSNYLLKEYIEKKINDECDPQLIAFIKDTSSDIHNRKLFPIPDETYPNGCCLPGVKKLCVDTSGNFHICEKINSNFSIGNVDKGFDIEKIFDLMRQYAEAVNHCKYCWAIRFCNSCIISAIQNDIISPERKQTNCEMSRESTLSRLINYVSMMDIDPKIFEHEYIRGENMVEEILLYLEKYDVCN